MNINKYLKLKNRRNGSAGLQALSLLLSEEGRKYIESIEDVSELNKQSIGYIKEVGGATPTLKLGKPKVLETMAKICPDVNNFINK
jgi:hypothetical protein